MDDLNLFDEESVDLLIAALKESPDHDETSPLYRALLTAKIWMARAEVAKAVVRSVRLEPMGAEVAAADHAKMVDDLAEKREAERDSAVAEVGAWATHAGVLEVEAERLRGERDSKAEAAAMWHQAAIDRAEIIESIQRAVGLRVPVDTCEAQLLAKIKELHAEAERLRRRAAIAEEPAAGARNNEEHLKGLVTELRDEVNRWRAEVKILEMERDCATATAISEQLAALTERLGIADHTLTNRINALTERVGAVEKNMATDSHAGIYCDIVSLTERVDLHESRLGFLEAEQGGKTAKQTCGTCGDGSIANTTAGHTYCGHHCRWESVGAIRRCWRAREGGE